MRRRYASILVPVLALALHGPVAAADAPDGETVTMAGNISYVSGGVGEESRERLAAFAAAFNLKLVLVGKSGEYLGDVRVEIRDAAGRALLQATADGPIFMANLPPGAYELVATADGVSHRQRAKVSAGRLSTLYFRWP